MKDLFNAYFIKSPKTTFCGLAILACLVAYLYGKITIDSLVVLIGLFGVGIGIGAKDGNTTGGANQV